MIGATEKLDDPFSSDAIPGRSLEIQSLADAGVQLVKGSLEDEESLVEAVNQVDVVICAIPSRNVLDQKPLIRVIKRAGHIKRFIPSEFGMDPDKVQSSSMDYGFYSKKAAIS
ncbi:putative pinoresinol-lariciresinol reductase 3 [Drosera capensis]